MHHLSNLQGLLLSALAWLVHCHRLRCHRFHFHSTTNDFDLQCISQIARFLMTWMRTPIDQISNLFDSLVSVTSIANTAIYISIGPRSFAPTSWSPCTYNGWHAPGVFSEFSISNASVWVDSWGHWGTGEQNWGIKVLQVLCGCASSMLFAAAPGGYSCFMFPDSVHIAARRGSP